VSQLDKMGKVNEVWAGLVRHWPILTKLYEGKEIEDLNVLMETIHRKYAKSSVIFGQKEFIPSKLFVETNTVNSSNSSSSSSS